MVAQCIEQFYYGGVGNFIKKKERVYDEPVQMDGDYKYVDDEESSEGASVTDSMKAEMIKRGLWKEKKSHRKGTGKNALEGIEEKDGEEDEEGKEGEDDEDEEEEEEEDEEEREKENEVEGITPDGENALVVKGEEQEDGAGLFQLTDGDIEAPPMDGTNNDLPPTDTGTELVVHAENESNSIGINNDQGERIEGDVEMGSYTQQQVPWIDLLVYRNLFPLPIIMIIGSAPNH